MASFIAALPMYDWPECADETRSFWHRIENRLRGTGFDDTVGFIRPSLGEGPDNLLAAPDLLMSQTCWGPISRRITPPLTILAQPDYSAFTGGSGPFYRSAIIATGSGENLPVPPADKAALPLDDMRTARFAFNDETSLSGMLAVQEDFSAKTGENGAFYQTAMTSGGHQNSVRMVADATADFAAIDCRSWALACKYEPAAQGVHIIGWTAQRMGLPYVCSPRIDPERVAVLRSVLIGMGCFTPEITSVSI
ncbi:MAG: PhnD/SsuA/transferrin family substrate-binding protein [Rhodobacteraceae bacterium]|nr:PhnD/SsuA/transferrin family substrate-binding protein [Paracoccaceae bacterium]